MVIKKALEDFKEEMSDHLGPGWQVEFGEDIAPDGALSYGIQRLDFAREHRYWVTLVQFPEQGNTLGLARARLNTYRKDEPDQEFRMIMIYTKALDL